MKPASKIPLSVIVVTKNEEHRIERCLDALQAFAEVVVVDSASTDKTASIVKTRDVRFVNFEWGGAHPKKRAWCLEILDLAHDWVFFVDADEIITPQLSTEIRALDLEVNDTKAGYFIKGRYIFDNKTLKFGLQNNKLALLNRRKIEFPRVDDLDISGMGELEGHYQPVLKHEFMHEKIGQLKRPLLHNAYDNPEDWQARHKRYAAWEREMDRRGIWPDDISAVRRFSKRLFKALPFRGMAAFLHCYVWKLGLFDGRAGFYFACSRKQYYDLIKKAP